jgi:6-pyruvoyltetrahydropterin/6-carboxytetrahydropterin synthase
MYVSTKHYGPEEGFAVAYRQWRADRKSGIAEGTPYSIDEIPGCCAIHGYAMSFYFEFESSTLDARNWVVDFGSLRPLKEFLKQSFDHTLLVAEDDPHHAEFIRLHKLGLAKVVEVENTGCEALSKFLYDYANTIFLPDHYPSSGEQQIHCRKVVVRETPSNSGWYEHSK